MRTQQLFPSLIADMGIWAECSVIDSTRTNPKSWSASPINPKNVDFDVKLDAHSDFFLSRFQGLIILPHWHSLYCENLIYTTATTPGVLQKCQQEVCTFDQQISFNAPFIIYHNLQNYFIYYKSRNYNRNPKDLGHKLHHHQASNLKF